MQEEQEALKYTCCFTGHRPEKLTQPEKEITTLLEKAIRTTVDEGFVTFISGMARGVDIWAAEIVLHLRDEGLPVRLICAVPYEGFERSWASHWQERYRRILEAGDQTRFICPEYSRSCFQKRNKWMVDHSARVIAVFNGEKGGTKNTVDYAKAHGVAVMNVFEM